MVTDSDLPRLQLVPPGAILDKLLDGIHRGVKTATSALEVSFAMQGQKLPAAGDQYVLVDSSDLPAGIIELTDVHLTPFGDIGLDVARAEGDWFDNVEQWRDAHRRFFNNSANEIAAYLNQPTWETTDDTMVVVRFFRVIVPSASGTEH